MSEKKQIILGTAGHIDHGKTSLIKAATGIDTDRLKEEKLRGITIELGFAFLKLPSGQQLGIVDVPGHEKFVKNMVAGATGIDLVAMVIAADEGVMPQTREHMEICSLLGIEHGVIVLTKIDMVDADWLELVVEDIRDYMRGSFLEDAPILQVSSTSGEGVSEFTDELDKICADIPQRPSGDLFRLPIDRVFTMKGFGTVITGTLISGRVKTGDTIALYPSGTASKVRGIQVHNQSVETAEAGMRTAINFQGLDRASANRGDIVSVPGVLRNSYMLDVSLHFLAGNRRPMKNRARIRFHSGTSEVLGRVVLLDSEDMQPGETSVAQLRLDAPASLVRDDRFVIRSYSPIRTIAGGRILDPIPVKHKRFRKEIVEGLKSLGDGTPEAILAFQIEAAQYAGVSFSDLRIMANVSEKGLNRMMQDLLSKQTAIQVDKDNRIYIHGRALDQLKADILGHLNTYHKANPLKSGMRKEELRSKLPSSMNPKLFTLATNQMIKEKQALIEDELIRSTDHRISLGLDQEDVRDRILTAYRESGLQPPYFKALSQTIDIEMDQARDVLHLLMEGGLVVRVKDDLYFDAGAIADLENELTDFLQKNGEISTPQFKEMTGASRKYVIPLIEYFDDQRVTIRIGDIRKLRKR